MTFSIISIDYQNDFCSPTGKFYKKRDCHTFIEQEFIPFLKDKNIKLAEIISDYRLPRPSEHEAYCVPGTSGYLSAIDATVKIGTPWIKSMNSPDWMRQHGGNPAETAGVPYQDSQAFTDWLIKTVGSPDQAGTVVLIGLTLDCCVLCTAQQLYFRNYKVKILKEGTDTYAPESIKHLLATDVDYKEILFSTTHGMWSQLITWKELKAELEKLSAVNLNQNSSITNTSSIFRPQK